MIAAPQSVPAAAHVTPGLAVADPQAAYWVARAILTLRREVCWCWRLRDPASPLAPLGDAAAENLDLVRYQEEKWRFFAADPAALYLTDRIDMPPPSPPARPRHGSWSWLVRRLGLDEAAQFLLGLALAARLDSGLGPVLATCLNDRSRPFLTLALAQRLWPDSLAIVACAESAHPLFRAGLLYAGEPGGDIGWLAPVEMHAAVARQLADPRLPAPCGLRIVLKAEARRLGPAGLSLVERLRASPPRQMEVVPLVGLPGTAFEDWAVQLAELSGRKVASVDAAAANEASALAGVAVVAWLRDLDLLMPEAWADRLGEKGWSKFLDTLEGVPVRWYLPVHGREAVSPAAAAILTPSLQIPPLSFEQRVARFRRGFGEVSAGAAAAIEECSRRFRFQETSIDRVVATFRGSAPELEPMILACRNEADSDLGGLAQPVSPRFQVDELVLPSPQRRQFEEILRAMQALTEVHYHWGTARAWNESGLAVLFSGPPGTGKTMGAEVLANALCLPLYRIDLSQVVNKYIGETEKNLKRIFDAAESSDCILFFDEADALFGKRTEVKDAHDRFANIEISYLLERMERFKGLAILATNRRKDIDEAFLRRLRYVIEFPLPGVPERERIWRQVFPGQVDVSELDFAFLARQFSLTGGHIRSIAFAACLQSAGHPRHSAADGIAAASHPEPPAAAFPAAKVAMDTVLVAVKRELEKMNRAVGEAVFGPRGEAVREEP